MSTPPLHGPVATGVLLVPISDLARDVQRYINVCLMIHNVRVTVHSTALTHNEHWAPCLAIEISKEHK